MSANACNKQKFSCREFSHYRKEHSSLFIFSFKYTSCMHFPSQIRFLELNNFSAEKLFIAYNGKLHMIVASVIS